MQKSNRRIEDEFKNEHTFPGKRHKAVRPSRGCGRSFCRDTCGLHLRFPGSKWCGKDYDYKNDDEYHIARDPQGILALVLSYIPPFIPFIMMTRLAVSPVPIWQVCLSVAMLIASVIFAMWVSARIFRVGILMYGKPPRLRELVKWLRYE